MMMMMMMISNKKAWPLHARPPRQAGSSRPFACGRGPTKPHLSVGFVVYRRRDDVFAIVFETPSLHFSFCLLTCAKMTIAPLELDRALQTLRFPLGTFLQIDSSIDSD